MTQRGSTDWYKQMHKELDSTVLENRKIQFEMAKALGAKQWIFSLKTQLTVGAAIAILGVGAFFHVKLSRQKKKQKHEWDFWNDICFPNEIKTFCVEQY